ncbi:MAG: AtpZ/AtpI family protein [Phycisphaeraceae bacterium]|nr:AtpZ/AtpI family protein [Phycisphaeraceae bacterium]
MKRHETSEHERERADGLRDSPPPPQIPELLREPVARPPVLDRNEVASQSGLANVSTAWGVAMDFVGSVIGALLLGYFADRWQGTSPRYTLIGMVVGFTFALYRIISRTLAEERREKERRNKRKQG